MALISPRLPCTSECLVFRLRAVTAERFKEAPAIPGFLGNYNSGVANWKTCVGHVWA